jgi:hypothetical protein
MTLRKPRLDWIKTVLADVETDGERASAAFGFVRRAETVSADVGSMAERPQEPEGEDGLLCPPCRLIRIAATRDS